MKVLPSRETLIYHRQLLFLQKTFFVFNTPGHLKQFSPEKYYLDSGLKPQYVICPPQNDSSDGKFIYIFFRFSDLSLEKTAAVTYCSVRAIYVCIYIYISI